MVFENIKQKQDYSKSKDYNFYYYDYIILGFGASGIASAIELKKTNHSFIILEKESRFGGCWNYALETSCLQTHRDYYMYEGISYEDITSNSFPNKAEILKYFEKVIKLNNLEDKVIYWCKYKIEYNNTIFNANDEANNINNNITNKYRWLLRVNNHNIHLYCNDILFCGGCNNIVNIPNHEIFEIDNLLQDIVTKTTLEKSDKTIVVHSKYINKYIYNDFFKEKRKIVIVGNGASCCDILKYIDKKYTHIDHELYVFYSSNKFFIPKYVCGISCHYFLSKPLIKIFEKMSLKLTIILITLANIIFFKNYLDIPYSKVNSYNIVASNIIQKLIFKNKLTYNKKDIISINKDKRLLKTDNGIYNDIDIIILTTGYKTSYLNIENINVEYDYLYKYVVPVKKNINKYTPIEGLGYIGFNRTYNFLINSQMRARWYIQNRNNLKNLDNFDNVSIKEWIENIEIKKKKNNIKFLDSTYEMFDLNNI